MAKNSTGAISGVQLDPDPIRLGRLTARFTVLAISPDADDHSNLAQLSVRGGWRLLSARTCQQALPMIRLNRVAVAICERDLPDGNWTAVFDQLERFPTAPLLIVASRLADDALWAEVLNVGGYDVLLKPLEPKEVIWSVASARRQWESHLQATFSVAPPPPAA